MTEYVGEMLGMSTVTKDHTYLEAKEKFTTYATAVKALKVAVGAYGEKLKATAETGASMRLLATQGFSRSLPSDWAEARATMEGTYVLAGEKAKNLETQLAKYCSLLHSTQVKTDQTTQKARRDSDHYQQKVQSLTKKLMSCEKDLSQRQDRDERQRREAEAKRQPPPTKTNYFWEDPLPVYIEKLEKLKQRLARNEHKLEVAKVWLERALNLGTLTFHTAVDDNDMETAHILESLLDLDQTLKEAAD